MHKFILSFLSLFFCLLVTIGFGQSKKDFQRKYLSAKHYYDAGNYIKSYNDFLELTKPHDKNEFDRIAHYFCGLSAIKANKLNDANFILTKAIDKYNHWNKLAELQYLLAIVYFERIDYFRAYQILDQAQANNKVKKEIPQLKLHYLLKAPSIEVLYDLLCEHENEKEIALILADKLNYENSSNYEKEMLEFLIQEYKLNKEDYPLGTFKSSKKKPLYNVALLLPYNTHNTSLARLVQNSRFFEMYEGTKMAVEELNKKGINIKLHTYDTKKDSATTAQLLALPEMANMDLLIGPIYTPMANLAADFASHHQINYINPLYANNELVFGNDNAFLLKPSYLAIGKELAIYASENFVDKDVIIFYGSEVRDSVMAYEYHHVLDSNFSGHINFFKITHSNVSDVQAIVKTEDSDVLSHIFVASNDRLMAANLMSALEEMNMHVPAIAPSKWLNTRIITYDQFKNISISTSTILLTTTILKVLFLLEQNFLNV